MIDCWLTLLIVGDELQWISVSSAVPIIIFMIWFLTFVIHSLVLKQNIYWKIKFVKNNDILKWLLIQTIYPPVHSTLLHIIIIIIIITTRYKLLLIFLKPQLHDHFELISWNYSPQFFHYFQYFWYWWILQWRFNVRNRKRRWWLLLHLPPWINSFASL